MDSELKKAVVKQVKELLLNDQGIQAHISNIKANNSDPYRVATDILENNVKAHEMIGIETNFLLSNTCRTVEVSSISALAKSALHNLDCLNWRDIAVDKQVTKFVSYCSQQGFRSCHGQTDVKWRVFEQDFENSYDKSCPPWSELSH